MRGDAENLKLQKTQRGRTIKIDLPTNKKNPYSLKLGREKENKQGGGGGSEEILQTIYVAPQEPRRRAQKRPEVTGGEKKKKTPSPRVSASTEKNLRKY